MKKTAITKNISVSAQDAWDVISDLSGVERYLPGVSSSQVFVHGVSVTRRINLMDGLHYEERIESIDHDNFELIYTIIDPSPFQYSGFRAVVKIEAAADNRCRIHWSCTYEVDDELAEDVSILLTIIMMHGASGIEREVKRMISFV